MSDIYYLTGDDIASVFTEWERRYREDPERFMSDMERLGDSCETYGEECAEYFLQILKEGSGEAQVEEVGSEQVT